jgi:hypothetical protein
MADTHRQLYQGAPAQGVVTTAYTVPGGTIARVYGVVVANTSPTAATFRIFLVPSGGSALDSNAIYKDIVVPGGDSFDSQISAVLGAAGFIAVFSSSGTHTFTISGLERTSSLDSQLAQNQPVTATETTVYTVPASNKALVYGIVVANVALSPGAFRIFLVPSGGGAGVGNAIYYDVNLPGQDTFAANIAALMEAGGFIVVYSDTGNHTFTISGLLRN